MLHGLEELDYDNILDRFRVKDYHTIRTKEVELHYVLSAEDDFVVCSIMT